MPFLYFWDLESSTIFFDGIQRPLEEIAKASGKYISRGVSVDSLDTEKKWNTHIIVKEGDVVGPGSVIAETQEIRLHSP